MRHRIDIPAGTKFARWTVLAPAGTRKHPGKSGGGCALFLARCECGTERTLAGTHLRNGHTRSCGCLRIDRVRTANKKRFGMHPDGPRQVLDGGFDDDANL